jgi:hypothetical protein
MAFTLDDLLPPDQQLRTIQLHEPVGFALNVMYQHGYGQLPVMGPSGEYQEQVITFDSVVRALQCFRTDTQSLLVRDAAQRVRSYPPDADLLATLDDIHRDNFAIIVDESKLGVVTTADVAVFFREYAEDLMLIEGIESRVKDAIRSLYAGDECSLDAEIAKVTDRAADIRKKLPAAIRAYLAKTKIPVPPEGSDLDAIADAQKRLGLPEPGKKFEDLTFDEFVNVLLRHEHAPRLSQSKDLLEIRGLLDQVRNSRNKLAHFRGDLSFEERRTIKFAAVWLENNLPVPPPEAPSPQPGPVVDSTSPHQEEIEEMEEGEVPTGSYALLATHLEAMPADTSSLTLTFPQIEEILKKELPRSAVEYRAWWSNDPTKPQSAAWLDQGWRTTSVRMTDRRLTFIRTNDREKAYIRFFSGLNGRLAAQKGFPPRNVSPQGMNWLQLASLNTSQPEAATIIASFSRQKRLRIELYLDTGDKDETKRLFEQLFARKVEIERIVGEPLEWERLDNRRASRVAIYTKAQILMDADSPTLLDWATKRAILFYQAFGQELISGGAFVGA